MRRSRLQELKVGKYYNEGWFGKHIAVYEIASRFLEPIRRRATHALGTARLRVLDIATGTGALALSLARAGHDVTGIDLDHGMVQRALRKLSPALSLAFRQGDATALPFDSGTFDAATVSFAMHDVPYPIGLRILQEARRVLRQEGVLLIVDYRDLADRLVPRMLRWIALLYESPNYGAFVRRSTPNLLAAAGFRVRRRSSVLQAVQITTAVP